MAFTQFTATTPASTTPVEAIEYPKYWITSMRVQAGDPLMPVKLVVTFLPARDTTIDVSGVPVPVKELMPNGQPKRLIVDDLFGSSYAGLSAALEGVFQAIQTVGTDQGIF